MSVKVLVGDCKEVMAEMEPNSIDTIITDPPYGLEFMGKEWDAPWQQSSQSALFGKRKRAIPGWGTTRNPTCQDCGGRLRGAKVCHCDKPDWDESPLTTRLKHMSLFQEWNRLWALAALRVAKPGATMLAFGGTRTHHRLMCAIEDAGWGTKLAVRLPAIRHCDPR